MKALWNFVNGFNTTRSLKNGLYLVMSVIFYSLIGGAVWFLIGRYSLPKTQDMLCFIGYPGVFAGFFVGLIYLYNHDFKSSL